MNRTGVILLRLAVAGALTILWWWVGIRFFDVKPGSESVIDRFVLLAWSVFTALIWGLLLGWPIVVWCGEKFGGLYLPSDNGFQIRPEYSIAEARVKQGRYEDAIVAFRADIEKFPDETYPHIRIAELQLEHLHDPDAAIAELRIAVTKANSEDAFALVAGRLADLLVQHQKNRAGAIEVLSQIGLRFPGTKHARAAAERIAHLQ